MPGPAGTLEAHNQFQQTFSQPSTTSGQHQQSYNTASRGSALSAFAGSPWGAVIGAGLEFGRDFIADKRNRKATEQAQRHADQQAEASFQRELSSQKAAAKYNSEANQVRRYLEAGLSPGLMYGQMSPSTMEAASSSAAQSVAPMASEINDNPAFLQAMQLMLQQMATGSTVGLQGAQARNLDVQTQGTAIDNLTRSQRNLQEIQTSIAQMHQMLASAGLSAASKARIYRLLDKEYEQMENAIAVGGSQIRANDASASLAPSQRAANIASANQSNAQADFIRGPQTEYTQQQSSTSFAQEQNLLDQNQRLEFDLKNDKDRVSWAGDFLRSKGYDPRLAPQLAHFLDDAPSEVLRGGVKAIESWLDAGNWLPFINSLKRNKTIEKTLSTNNAKDTDIAGKGRMEAIDGDRHQSAELAKKVYGNLNPDGKEKFKKFYNEMRQGYKQNGYNIDDPAIDEACWSYALEKWKATAGGREINRNPTNHLPSFFDLDGGDFGY